MFCKALIIFIFAGICFIDCCLMISSSRYNRKMEQQIKISDGQDKDAQNQEGK